MAVEEAEAIAGMDPTGRRVATPAAELVELKDSRGLKHLAFVPNAVHRTHPSLSDGLQLGWMENPEVTGLARLVHHDPVVGRFVYATGTCWTVAEIVRIYAEEEQGAGVKAGLELCYLVAEALAEAHDAGTEQGVFSHGNLNPWTIVVKPDGQPLVIGYGIPQVEMRVWQEDPREVPKEDSFRYAPPERLEGHDEDIASDLFALSLVGLELMVGRPVYDGLLDDIRQQATRGEGMRRLYQWREQLPANVREVLGRALKPDPDTRYRRALDFVYAVHDLLGSIDVEGPPLVEVMAKVRAVTKRGKGPIIGGKTGMLTPEELRELAADLDVEEARPLPAPRAPRPPPEPDLESEEAGDAPDAPRWQKRAAAEPPPPPDAKAEARDRLKRRLRRSGTEAEPESARDRLRRRLKASGDDATEEAAPRRQLRRNPTDDAGAPRPRRRRRDVGGVSQSIDLGDPLGFDDDEEHTDIGFAPMPLDEPTEADLPGADAAPTGSDASDGATFEEAETAVSPLATSGGAAALLERLRSSTGERRRRRPRRATTSGDEAPATSATPAPPAETAAPAVAVPPAAPGLDLAEPLGATPPVAPARRPRPPEPEPEDAVDADDELGFDVETMHLEDQRSANEAEPTGALDEVAARLPEPGSSIAVVGPGGREVVLAVLADEIVASVVARAVVRLGLTEVDLSGRVVGGWRGAIGGSPVSGTLAAATIERLGLVPVPDGTRRVRIGLPGDRRAELPIPLSVPSGAVARHLGRLFGVDGPVQMAVGGAPIAHDVLIVEALGDGTALEVIVDTSLV